MKKIFLLLCMMSAIFTGCNASDAPRDVVDKALAAYKDQDFAAFAEYMSDFPSSLNLPESNRTKTVIDAHTDITYRIRSTQMYGDMDAIVMVDITSRSLNSALQIYYNNAMRFIVDEDGNMVNEAADGEDAPSADDMFDEAIQSPDVEVITARIPIQLTKIDDVWKIVPTSELVTGLTNYQYGTPDEIYAAQEEGQ